MPTSQLLDWLSFADPCVSISLKGEFLATAHEGRNYISLWSDKSYYGTVHGERPTRPYAMEGQDSEHDEEEESAAVHSPPPPILASEDGPVVPKANGLVTMSGLPDGMWKSLFHLETVKARNKPKEKLEKPEAAPFFLQRRGDVTGLEEAGTGPGNGSGGGGEEKKEEKKLAGWDEAWSDDDDDAFADGEDEVEDFAAPQSRILKSGAGAFGRGGSSAPPPPNKLASLLADDHDTVTAYLHTLSPSAVDVAISTLCLGSHDPSGIVYLASFVLYLTAAFASRRNYETASAYLSRFLELHSEVLLTLDPEGDGEKVKEMVEGLKKLKKEQADASVRLRERLEKGMAMAAHFQGLL